MSALHLWYEGVGRDAFKNSFNSKLWIPLRMNTIGPLPSQPRTATTHVMKNVVTIRTVTILARCVVQWLTRALGKLKTGYETNVSACLLPDCSISQWSHIKIIYSEKSHRALSKQMEGWILFWVEQPLWPFRALFFFFKFNLLSG